MPDYKTPGVYIEDASRLPATVPALDTSLPAFIGYTEKAGTQDAPLALIPTTVTSLLEYEALFGAAPASTLTLWLNAAQHISNTTVDRPFYLYDSVRLFFANGGVQCMIVSVGDYSNAVTSEHLAHGLEAIATHPEPTLIAMPDLALCPEPHTLEATALAQSAQSPHRFAIFDLGHCQNTVDFAQETTRFKQRVGSDYLSNGAAYGPWLVASLPRTTPLSRLTFKLEGTVVTAESLAQDEHMRALIAQIRQAEKAPEASGQCALLNELLYTLHTQARQWIDAAHTALNTLPPCGAVAGVYAATDQARGIWKAPANVSLQQVRHPVFNFSDQQQAEYNVDVNTGKSINLIRMFPGKGTLVWGARTLAGNDNEWRYISVRRLCRWVEASITLGLQSLVFEPNDANTWTRTQAMIEHFLTLLWRQGAFQGSKPEHAFFVQVGLGKTMTANDIAQGWMLVDIGLAVVRPAEFIILRVKQKQSAA
jgi:phage tail sheath protein FI